MNNNNLRFNKEKFINNNSISSSDKKNRGFTMIELLVVIAIIGTLSATATPKLIKELRKGKVAKIQHNLGVIRSRLSLDETLLDKFPDLAGEEGGDNTDLLETYSIEATPVFTDEDGITHPETNQVLDSRDNTGGWFYDRTEGDIYANLPNGAYTYDEEYEIWDEDSSIISEEVQVLVDSGIIDENGVYQNNGSFEDIITGNFSILNADLVPDWNTTATDNKIEVWGNDFQAVNATDGNYFIELNANQVASLYQDIETVPGTTLEISVSHRGRTGEDTASLSINGTEAVTMIDGNTEWGTYIYEYEVPEGQTVTTFSLDSIASASSSLSVGNFIDNFNIKVIGD